MEILYVDESWYYLILINLSHDCTKCVLKIKEALTKNKQPLMKWSILLVSLPLEDIFRVLIAFKCNEHRTGLYKFPFGTPQICINV